jgi:hypothetical protein
MGGFYQEIKASEGEYEYPSATGVEVTLEARVNQR